MKTDIVCLGDSIVFGYGAPAGGGWPERSARRLGKHIVNSGENGDTTDEMLGRFEWDVVRYQPKEVVIMGGANDILMGIKQAHTRETVTLLVERAFRSNIQPIIGIPISVDAKMLKQCWYSCWTVEETLERFRAFHDWLENFCKKRAIPAVDFYREYPDRMERITDGKWYVDGLHPTREGYRVLADIFCETYRSYQQG